MQLLDRKEVKYALGVCGLGALLYGIFKAYRFFTKSSPHPDPPNQENFSDKSTLSEDQNNEHIPYDLIIEDLKRDKMRKGSIGVLNYLRDLNYRIILCLMKGNSYQGIVNISFLLDNLKDDQDFKVNFNGSGVKFVMVNGQTLDARDVRYVDHCILIPRQLLKEKSRNSIEVIFENHYSFLNHGLSAYFMIDENHKYSLRQQVIYSANGYLEVEKMVPCINCLNECKVQLEAIHPDTFEVFSNSSKSLERFCSVTEYQRYPFLFDLSSNSLNKSFKMNASTISNDSSSQYSSTNFYNRKKANTHFYPTRLPSIHNLFIFSSAMIELQPTAVNSALEEQVLIRYFCKHMQSHRFVRNVNKIHNYILDIFRRLAAENIKQHISKVDVIILDDRQIEGFFSPGIILLSEATIGQGDVDIRCLYLIVRALMGMLQLEKGNNVVTLSEILQLNEMVFGKFQEFRNFIYIKNMKYDKIRSMLNNPDLKDYLSQQEGHLVKYYAKELKYIIKDCVSHKISFELNNLMLSFSTNTQEEFWQNFLSNYNFLSPLITQPLLKLGIRKLSVPTNQRLLEQLKLCFNSSKYLLNFYTNQEISDNLPKFMERQSFGLEARLTQLKVKQKFKDYITQKYQKYLPIKSNMAEAQAVYNQFKKFHEGKNFHHISLLKSEIKRVGYFGKDFIKPERVNINCSIMGWKLLRKLKIYPLDDDYFRFLRTVDEVQQ